MISRQPAPRSVFISYRRGPGGGFAADLHNRIRRRYGRRRVFRDVSEIRGGAPWQRQLQQELDRAGAVVAVIHQGWAAEIGHRVPTGATPAGADATAGPEGAGSTGVTPDWLVWELSRAMDRGALVVPLLVGQASDQVEARDLPAAVAPLGDRQWRVVVSGQEDTSLALVWPDIDRALGWWGRSIHRWTTTAISLVALVGIALGLVVALQPPHIPRFARTDLSTLIAPVVETIGEGQSGQVTEVGRHLGQSLAGRLTSALGTTGPGFTVAALSDAGLALPPGDPPPATVRRLLDASNADLLVDVRLERSGNRSTVTVRMWFGDLSYGEDTRYEPVHLDDRHETVTVFGDIGVVEHLEDSMLDGVLAAVEPAARVPAGLALYEQRNLKAATQVLASLTGPGSPFGDRTAALLHHLEGNAQLDTGATDEAERSYREALTLDPTFERSRIGLAEVNLVRGQGGDCRLSHINSDALEQAEQLLNDVLSTTGSWWTASKALVDRARVRHCRLRAASPVASVDTVGTAAAIADIDQAFANVTPEDQLILGDLLGEAALVRSDLRLMGDPDTTGFRAAADDLALAAQRFKRPWRVAEADLRLARLIDDHPELPPLPGIKLRSPRDLRLEACAALAETRARGIGGEVGAEAAAQLADASVCGGR